MVSDLCHHKNSKRKKKKKNKRKRKRTFLKMLAHIFSFSFPIWHFSQYETGLGPPVTGVNSQTLSANLVSIPRKGARRKQNEDKKTPVKLKTKIKLNIYNQNYNDFLSFFSVQFFLFIDFYMFIFYSSLYCFVVSFFSF